MKISHRSDSVIHVVSCSLFGGANNSVSSVESAESSVQKLSSLFVDWSQTSDDLGGSGGVSSDSNIRGVESSLTPLVLEDGTVWVVVRLVSDSEVIYSSELLSRFACCLLTSESNAAWVSEALGWLVVQVSQVLWVTVEAVISWFWSIWLNLEGTVASCQLP